MWGLLQLLYALFSTLGNWLIHWVLHCEKYYFQWAGKVVDYCTPIFNPQAPNTCQQLYNPTKSHCVTFLLCLAVCVYLNVHIDTSQGCHEIRMGKNNVKFSRGSRISNVMSMGIKAFAVSSALCSWSSKGFWERKKLLSQRRLESLPSKI